MQNVFNEVDVSLWHRAIKPSSGLHDVPSFHQLPTVTLRATFVLPGRDAPDEARHQGFTVRV